MWRKLFELVAFVISRTSKTLLFVIRQRFKGHFLKELRVSFKNVFAQNYETLKFPSVSRHQNFEVDKYEKLWYRWEEHQKRD